MHRKGGWTNDEITMFSIDGVFLFKLYALSTLYELFTQKHMTVELQNSTLDAYYKLNWYRNCTIMFRDNVKLNMELVDFCHFLFEKFFPSQKLIFINKNLKPQIFNYATRKDYKNGFRARKFLALLHRDREQDRGGNCNHMGKMRSELIDLLERIEYIQSKNKEDRLEITFTNWKEYKTLFDFISTQYECVSRGPQENDNKFFLYATIDCCHQLDFKVFSN